MKTNVDLRTVDLSAYPDLVAIYLGMRVRTFPGIKTLLGLGPQIDKAGAGRPDGLLHYEAVRKFSPVRSCPNVHSFHHNRSERVAPKMTSAMRARVPGSRILRKSVERKRAVCGNLPIGYRHALLAEGAHNE